MKKHTPILDVKSVGKSASRLSTKLNVGFDIRQSSNWEKYFNLLGWKGYRIKNGGVIFIHKTFMGGLVKIQRIPSLKKEDLREIEDICRKEKALFIKIEPIPNQDLSILEKEDYQISLSPLAPSKTLVINLTKSVKELWNDLSHSAKYSVTRAKREGSKVISYTNPNNELLKTYYEMEKYTGKTHKFYVQPYSDLLKRRDCFKDNSHLILVYDKNNNLASGKFFLTYENTALYLNGGTSKEGRRSKAGYDLMWESILYFKKLGFKKLDLDGIDDVRFPVFTKSWGGFSFFKEKFGGSITIYPYPYIKYLSPAFKLFSRIGFQL